MFKCKRIRWNLLVRSPFYFLTHPLADVLPNLSAFLKYSKNLCDFVFLSVFKSTTVNKLIPLFNYHIFIDK